MRYPSTNRFRARRGRVLRRQIEILARHLKRDVVILDIGGRPDYWANIGVEGISQIIVLNHDSRELNRELLGGLPENLFERRIGDARNLSDYADGSIDMAHSNSVIEHVGGWGDMRRMAGEMLRVGRAGWMQTPAWEFPIEPHFRAPFGHWFGKPAQARMMSLSTAEHIRRLSRDKRRERVEMINLMSKGEVRSLFPGCAIYTERVILAKSYVAHWLPEGVA